VCGYSSIASRRYVSSAPPDPLAGFRGRPPGKGRGNGRGRGRGRGGKGEEEGGERGTCSTGSRG